MHYVLGEVGFVFLSSHYVYKHYVFGRGGFYLQSSHHIYVHCVLGKGDFCWKFKHKTFDYSFKLCCLHIMFVPLCWLYHNPFETICKLNFTSIPCLTTKFQQSQSLSITFVSSLEFQRFGLYTFWNSLDYFKNSLFNFEFVAIFFLCHLFISIAFLFYFVRTIHYSQPSMHL